MEQDALPRPKTALAPRRRASASRCERALWHELRAKRLDGWKFHREAPIGQYVVDFVCFEAKLVVGADGPLHSTAEQKEADQRREAWLGKAGFRVCRFSEELILSDLARVLEEIRHALPQASPSPGSLRNPPSPLRGEDPRLPAAPPTRKVMVIACGALAREIGVIVEVNGLSDIELTCLPAMWHNRPEKIAPGVRELVRQNRGKYSTIAVAYAECGTQGELDKVCAEEGVERIAGPHCYSFYWGNDVFAARADDDIDAFFLTDFLARQFESFVIEPLGLDRHPELRDMYFGNYRRLIFLAQTDDAELEAKARAAAEHLGLSFEMRRTGLGDLTGFLTSLGGAAAPNSRP